MKEEIIFKENLFFIGPKAHLCICTHIKNYWYQRKNHPQSVLRLFFTLLFSLVDWLAAKIYFKILILPFVFFYAKSQAFCSTVYFVSYIQYSFPLKSGILWDFSFLQASLKFECVKNIPWLCNCTSLLIPDYSQTIYFC